ncbi:MAG: hypothetical protein AAF526_01935, partial [Pseudomonadota bacterium]
LRAVARLQDADLIIHDANAEPEVLELARRDAARDVLSGEGQAAQIKALAADNPLIAVLVMAPEADDLAGALKTLGLEVEQVPASTARAPRRLWRLAG